MNTCNSEEEDLCGCGSAECGCETKEEGSCCGSEESCCDSEYELGDMMLYLAKKAKFELLKEKIKKKLETTSGKELDEAADLIVKAMMEWKKGTREMAKKREELEEKLEAIFNK